MANTCVLVPVETHSKGVNLSLEIQSQYMFSKRHNAVKANKANDAETILPIIGLGGRFENGWSIKKILRPRATIWDLWTLIDSLLRSFDPPTCFPPHCTCLDDSTVAQMASRTKANLRLFRSPALTKCPCCIRLVDGD